jgi:hypothetical protein
MLPTLECTALGKVEAPRSAAAVFQFPERDPICIIKIGEVRGTISLACPGPFY